jgi:hypothetical protein
MNNPEERRPFEMTSALGFHASGAILGFGHGLWKGLPMNQIPKRMAGGVTIVFGLYVLQESAFRNMRHHFAFSRESMAGTVDGARENGMVALDKAEDNWKEASRQVKVARCQWRERRARSVDAALEAPAVPSSSTEGKEG